MEGLVEMFSMEEVLHRAMIRMANELSYDQNGQQASLWVWHGLVYKMASTLHSSLGVQNLGCRGPLQRKPCVLFCRLGNPIVFLPSTAVG